MPELARVAAIGLARDWRALAHAVLRRDRSPLRRTRVLRRTLPLTEVMALFERA